MNERAATAATVAPEAAVQLDEERDQRERFWRAVDQIRELNKDEDPDEVLAFVTQVVKEVRQERHEREQRDAEGRR